MRVCDKGDGHVGVLSSSCLALLFIFLVLVPCGFADARVSVSTHGNSSYQNGMQYQSSVGSIDPLNIETLYDSETGTSVRFSFDTWVEVAPISMSIIVGEDALHEAGSCIACDEMRSDLPAEMWHSFFLISTTPADLTQAATVVRENDEAGTSVERPEVEVSIPLSSKVRKSSIEVYECAGDEGMRQLESEVVDDSLQFVIDGRYPFAVSYRSSDEQLFAGSQRPIIVDDDEDSGGGEEDEEESEEDRMASLLTGLAVVVGVVFVVAMFGKDIVKAVKARIEKWWQSDIGRFVLKMLVAIGDWANRKR